MKVTRGIVSFCLTRLITSIRICESPGTSFRTVREIDPELRFVVWWTETLCIAVKCFILSRKSDGKGFTMGSYGPTS